MLPRAFTLIDKTKRRSRKQKDDGIKRPGPGKRCDSAIRKKRIAYGKGTYGCKSSNY
jgi:hypothetical protein